MKIIYPGTFDPFSLGHLDMVIRASELYKSVIVAVSENNSKNPMFSFKDRIKMVELALDGNPKAEVVGFKGLLVDLMKQRGLRHALRGIRGMVDFEYEFQMAQVNRSMLPGYEPIFLMPGEKYMVLNSTIIREVAYYGGDISNFIPGPIIDYIKPLIRRKNV